MATAKKVKKVSRASLMRQYYNGNPTATANEVAKKFNTTYQIAYMCKKEMEKKKLSAPKRKPALWQPPEVVPMPEPVKPEEPKADPVNHPAHYKVGGIETIDFIEAKALGYHLGNAVKYITRADHKGNRLQDLQKAKWYIDRAIEKAGA
jgi:hypothetical protein